MNETLTQARELYTRYGDLELPHLEALITCADLEVLPAGWTWKPASSAVWVDYGRGRS